MARLKCLKRRNATHHGNNLISGLDVLDEVDDSAWVAVLVVVPGDEFHEGVGKLDSGEGVEDGGVGVSDKVSGDDFVFGVS